MISLILSFVILIGGYIIFSRIAERTISPDSRKTPSIAINDGVDCVPMSKPKLFLVQLLNIAGTGPIFGPIMGAVFGPVVFLWIIFGTILGGAVHDFMVGMISSRHKGSSIAELSGIYLGKPIKWIMRIFSVILLILCGTVFLVTPAGLLADMTPDVLSKWFWVGIIVAYYFLATILPIDKIIGKLYPIFGILLLGMAFSVLIACFAQGKATNIPEIWNGFGLENPNGLPTWPFMFVTVACGAISGFHATQSPMVAKCIENEHQGRQVFYGAMVGEAIIALIWASVGVAFYGSTQALQSAINSGGTGGVVSEVSNGLLGTFGGILAIIGVIVCPITSGDTAFRSARLIVAETVHLDQKKVFNRLLITIPIVGIGVGLAFLDFQVLWRYFAAANQTLAMIALWICSFYLLKKGKYKHVDLITAIPATFMVAVSMTYIIMAEECFKAPYYIGYPLGASLAACAFIAYVIYRSIYLRKINDKRPMMFSYESKQKKERKILIKEFKEHVNKCGLHVVTKEEIGIIIAKILPIYQDQYIFLQKNRVGMRVEEILDLRAEVKKYSIKPGKKSSAFKYFFLRNRSKFKLWYKSKTVRFLKPVPMDIKLYYDYFMFHLQDSLQNAVIFSPKAESANLFVVYPPNFHGIKGAAFFKFKMNLHSLFKFKTGELHLAENFNNLRTIHMEDNVNNKYWYIYDFLQSDNDDLNKKMINCLTSFLDNKSSDVYIDVVYHFYDKLLQESGFEKVFEEGVDYAKIPHSFYKRVSHS